MSRRHALIAAAALGSAPALPPAALAQARATAGDWGMYGRVLLSPMGLGTRSVT